MERGGFLPLSHQRPNPEDNAVRLAKTRSEDHVVNIPLTPIRSNVSTGARKEGQRTPQPELIRRSTDELDQLEHKLLGRRRLTGGKEGAEQARLNSLGRFYEHLLNFSIVTRYLFYIFPVSLVLSIPTLIGAFGPGRDATIGGVRVVWFFLWIQVVWVSLWISKLFAKALPHIYQVFAGVVSSGVRKYATIIRALELPISLVGWAVTSLTTFTPLMTRNPDKLRIGDTRVKTWQVRMNSVLAACLVSSLVYLGQKVFVQLVSVNYHRKQFQQRIQDNKRHVRLLGQMYEASRSLFPDYTEFAEEDYIIHQGLAGSVLTPMLGQKKNGGATPVRQFISNMNVVGNKVTSAFGNIAQEVVGNKNVFNPNSAYSVVLEALQRKSSAEALAKRIWMSFVAEGNEALYKGDISEVMGSENEDVAMECFIMLDKDGNGDVSLDEMTNGVHFIRNERRDVVKSMQDVDNAIGVLDSVLGTVVFIIVVFVFVAFNLSNFNTMLAAAGTVLLSLSFVFAITAQEVLGSCIFLFVKHPYDVGDRVDLDDKQYTVEHISLLYTVFRKCESNKTVQIPNNVLNTKVIENVSRSKYMKEMIKVSVNYDTTLEDIEALRQEMLKFITDNNRDYQPDFDIEILGVNNLDQLDLKIEIRYKSNWANEQLTLQRRNKFLCAFALACKRIPVYGPPGGDPLLGEPGKPSYTVAISDELAQKNMEQARKDKLAKRYDAIPEAPQVENADEVPEPRKPDNVNAPNFPATSNLYTGGYRLDGYENPSFQPYDNSSLRKRGSVRSYGSKQDSIREIKSLLTREATRGRRKAGQGSAMAVVRSGSSSRPPLSPSMPYTHAHQQALSGYQAQAPQIASMAMAAQIQAQAQALPSDVPQPSQIPPVPGPVAEVNMQQQHTNPTTQQYPPVQSPTTQQQSPQQGTPLNTGSQF